MPGSMQKSVYFGSKQMACVRYAIERSLQEHLMMC